MPTTQSHLPALNFRVLKRDMFAVFYFFLFFFLFFLLYHVAFSILVPQVGLNSVSPAVEAQSPNHWTTREIQKRSMSSIKQLRMHSKRTYFQPQTLHTRKNEPVLRTNSVLPPPIRAEGHRTLPRSQQAPAFSLQPRRSEVFLLREESGKQGSWLKVLHSSEDKEMVRGAESIHDIN